MDSMLGLNTEQTDDFRQNLLAWYDRHGRDLPWRYKNGAKADPYRVWLSEIMCQQTTVQAVIPYFLRFTELWPTVNDMAASPQEDIMTEWAGLGYYARARNLYKCAGIVANELAGIFPNTKEQLQELPGIGDYTSAAISALAFNKPATVVDGNIERLMARLFAITEPVPKSKPKLKELARPFFEGFTERPGDLAQAMMDLGAMVCTPKSPKCMICPVSQYCKGKKQGIAENLPTREKKKPKPQKHGYVYWIENDVGEILLERRDPKSMMGGMMAFPTSEWLETSESLQHIDTLATQTIPEAKTFITHSFTHFDLKLHLIRLTNTPEPPENNHQWLTYDELFKIGFPTLFKKAFKIWTAED